MNDEIKSELAKWQKRLDTLGDTEINGFAIIFPPGGEPVAICTLDTEAAPDAWVKYLLDRLSSVKQKDDFGAIDTRRFGGLR